MAKKQLKKQPKKTTRKTRKMPQRGPDGKFLKKGQAVAKPPKEAKPPEEVQEVETIDGAPHEIVTDPETEAAQTPQTLGDAMIEKPVVPVPNKKGKVERKALSEEEEKELNTEQKAFIRGYVYAKLYGKTNIDKTTRGLANLNIRLKSV